MPTDGQNVTYIAASSCSWSMCVFIENNDFQFLGKLDCVVSSDRPRRASLSSKDGMKGDTVFQQLTKKLQNLKKKIKQFEEQFEKEKNYKVRRIDSFRDRITVLLFSGCL